MDFSQSKLYYTSLIFFFHLFYWLMEFYLISLEIFSFCFFLSDLIFYFLFHYWMIFFFIKTSIFCQKVWILFDLKPYPFFLFHFDSLCTFVTNLLFIYISTTYIICLFYFFVFLSFLIVYKVINLFLRSFFHILF